MSQRGAAAAIGVTQSVISKTYAWHLELIIKYQYKVFKELLVMGRIALCAKLLKEI